MTPPFTARSGPEAMWWLITTLSLQASFQWPSFSALQSSHCPSYILAMSLRITHLCQCKCKHLSLAITLLLPTPSPTFSYSHFSSFFIPLTCLSIFCLLFLSAFHWSHWPGIPPFQKISSVDSSIISFLWIGWTTSDNYTVWDHSVLGWRYGMIGRCLATMWTVACGGGPDKQGLERRCSVTKTSFVQALF